MWKKIIALLLLFALTIPGYRSHIFSLDFVDEEDNIVIGSYLENGKKLYRDIYSQHQPAQFVLANVLQKVTSPDNILMTVKRHREFMILWGIFWITLLTFRFGFPLYITSLVFELTKMILLGNMFLAESFVVYPLIYLCSHLFLSKFKYTNLEEIFVLSLIWFLALSLTPLWPLLFAITLYLFVVNKLKTNFLLRFFTLGMLSLTLFYPKVDFLDYYNDVFWINTKFYIPLTTGISITFSILHAFFSPFFVLLTSGDSLLLPVLKILSLLFLYNIVQLIRNKQILRALALYFLLFLSGLRYIDPGNTLYGGFHMLPWYGTLLFGALVSLSLPRFARLIVLTVVLFASVFVARILLWDQRDPGTDYFVHYSPSADLSQVVKIISTTTSRTVWVEPVNYWIHYQNNSTLYTTMINYYRWMDQTPPLKMEISQKLSQKLPDLVYLNNQNLALGEVLSQYAPFVRDGNTTQLYLRRDLLPTLTPQQLEQLVFYRFTF